MDATVVPFQAVTENFNEYLLSDGTVLNMKLVVTEVVRIDNMYDDQGQPVYSVNSQNVTSISVPDELLRRPDGGTTEGEA
ncbi:MAG: hypothetical protein ABR600_09415 [Actinomycetota bacterium]